MNTLDLILVTAGLTLVSAVNRSFFFLSRRELPMPEGLVRGLRYAPLGALIAVVVPEIVQVGGVPSMRDPRVWSALLAAFYTRLRPKDMLGTIAIGMALYLTLKLGLGW